MVSIDAIMHKLLHIVFCVLKHNKPFDLNYIKQNINQSIMLGCQCGIRTVVFCIEILLSLQYKRKVGSLWTKGSSMSRELMNYNFAIKKRFQEICEPLYTYFGLTFGFMRVYNDGRYLKLYHDTEFLRDYFYSVKKGNLFCSKKNSLLLQDQILYHGLQTLEMYLWRFT